MSIIDVASRLFCRVQGDMSKHRLTRTTFGTATDEQMGLFKTVRRTINDRSSYDIEQREVTASVTPLKILSHKNVLCYSLLIRPLLGIAALLNSIYKFAFKAKLIIYGRLHCLIECDTEQSL